MKIESTTRVYIAGCGGMLGAAVYRRFDSVCTVRASDLDPNETWLHRVDIRDHALVARELEEFKPDLIVNLAALTDLEQCEREPENTFATNTVAAEHLGSLAESLEVPYVFISTAGIFAGEKDVYTEDDIPEPLSVYGESKYLAETSLQSKVKKLFVFRAGWMMGGGPNKDKKFVNKIFKQLLAGSRELRVVDDKLGTPTYTHDFAAGIAHVVQHGPYGLYNQVGGGGGSRYDVAVEFVQLLGLQRHVKVVKVDSSEWNREYFAARPRSEQLVNAKLDRLGLNVMRDWRVCLGEYAATFRAQLPAALTDV